MEIHGSPLQLPPSVANPPNTFAIRSAPVRFFSAYNRRVVERIPISYSVSSALERWGLPVFCDQMAESHVFELIVRKSSQEASMVGDKDIYLSEWLCKPLAETRDFRASPARRRPRYAAMVAPSRIRDNTESQLWTSFTLMDSALTGDPWSDLRDVYCSGGIVSIQFDLAPSISEVRVLNDPYRLAGATCGDAPIGLAQTHAVPGSGGGGFRDFGMQSYEL